MKIDSKARKILESFPRNVRDFFNQISQKCQKHGIKFRVSSYSAVYSGTGACSGYFCDQKKELAIAINNSLKWVLSTLVHEDSHFDQWLDQKSIWHDKQNRRNFDNFFDWLLKIKNIKNPTESAKHVVRLEADCERRSIKKIKKSWSKIISPEVYAQNANAYMFSYLYMAKSRKWLSRNFGLSQKAFYQNFPEKILNKFDSLPEKYSRLFSRKCKSDPK